MGHGRSNSTGRHQVIEVGSPSDRMSIEVVPPVQRESAKRPSAKEPKRRREADYYAVSMFETRGSRKRAKK